MNKYAPKVIDTIRILSADSIEKAKSGHPGTPIGAAPVVYTLYNDHLKHNPKNPGFFNRDRFVLSVGHASSMLYSILHLCGYDISKEDLASFRQLKSKTPGHPELGVTAGVDISTGPLGQGIANAVGFALAEKVLSTTFNTPDFPIIDHYTYAFCGDGCMMEGVEMEAASLAGTWGLEKLILIYDKNDITIEGSINLACDDDVASRHVAQGWHVITVDDGEDIEVVSEAISIAKAEKTRPSLIIVRTKIGRGTLKENSADVHGAPLGAAALEDYKQRLGWKLEPFESPDEVKEFRECMRARGERYEAEWNRMLVEYKIAYPEQGEELEKWINGKYDLYKMPELWEPVISKDTSTRTLSGIILNKLVKIIPNLIGGSADLGPSNKTVMNGVEYFSKVTTGGRGIHFGVREMAMAAVCNGLAANGGFFPFCSTFFVFSDYMKGSMRMSAMMKLPVMYILSHDSIAVGEDGPTHEPIEQLTMLRATPNLEVWRPANVAEIAAAYAASITDKRTVALITSRQPIIISKEPNKDDAVRGGYVLSDCEGTPEIILMGSGSEVSLLIGAQTALEAQNIPARVVSLPCHEVFDAQPKDYRDAVLPPSVRIRIAVEAGSRLSWGKYVGLDGDYICMDKFGESAPYSVLFKINRFSVEDVTELALSLRAGNKS